MKTIRCWLTVLFFATCAGSVFGAETNKMVLRCYPILTVALFETDIRSEAETDDHVRAYFEKTGVSFPTNSFIHYERALWRICMFNTEANHQEMKHILAALQITPSSLELDASFIAFDLPDIEALARVNTSAAPTRQQIADLWKAGKGHILATHKLITRSGVNAQTQGVDEFIYPTEFVKPETTNAPANASASLPVPSSFETREVGMIFNITPTVQPDGQTIDLVLAPELSDGDVTDDIATTLSRGENSEESLIVRQPRFHSAKFTTTIAVKDGATFIQGGMAARDGQVLTYLFLTARIIGTDGTPIHPDADQQPPESAPKKK